MSSQCATMLMIDRWIHGEPRWACMALPSAEVLVEVPAWQNRCLGTGAKLALHWIVKLRFPGLKRLAASHPAVTILL